jgi:hypothetical protein
MLKEGSISFFGDSKYIIRYRYHFKVTFHFWFMTRFSFTLN